MIGTPITITLNHDQLQQLTINYCLKTRSILTIFSSSLSSTATDLVQIYFTVVWMPEFLSERQLIQRSGILGNCLLLARIHGHACCFRGNERVSKSLQLSFSHPRTHLFNTQRWFVSKNRISAEMRLLVCFLETAYMSQWFNRKYWFCKDKDMPITVAARCKAWMSVCVYSVFCVVLCVGIGLATGWSPVQGALPTVYRLRNWEKRLRSIRTLQP
jgi:hypothetical protein